MKLGMHPVLITALKSQESKKYWVRYTVEPSLLKYDIVKVIYI